MEEMDCQEEDRGSGSSHSGVEPEAHGETEGSVAGSVPVPVTANGQGGSQGSSSGSPDTESPVMISVDVCCTSQYSWLFALRLYSFVGLYDLALH